MPQNRLRLGLRPRPHWGSLRRSPRPPSRLGRGIPPPPSTPRSRRPEFDFRKLATLCTNTVASSMHFSSVTLNTILLYSYMAAFSHYIQASIVTLKCQAYVLDVHIRESK